MNHRFVVPALGLIALSATAASAQEVAKGLFIDGYVDTNFGLTTFSVDGQPSTTDFTSEGVLKVGYNIGDKVKGFISTRTGPGGGVGGAGGDNNQFQLYEAFGTVDAGNGITFYSGKSTGPFGYYSAYATGISTVNVALTQSKMYTVNPIGAWVNYAVNDKFNFTVIVADGFSGNGGIAGKPTHNVAAPATDAAANNNVSPGIDFVFNPTAEVSLNLEGYIDPNAGAAKADGTVGNIAFVGFNAQYKKDAWVAAGEILYKTTANGGETETDAFTELGWAAFTTYTIPEAKFPMAATLQLSQYLTGKTPTKDNDALTQIQATLLTNPTGSSQFGANLEVFYTINDKKNNADDKADTSLGVALEAIYIIP